MKKKILLLLTLAALVAGQSSAWAQTITTATYNPEITFQGAMNGKNYRWWIQNSLNGTAIDTGLKYDGDDEHECVRIEIKNLNIGNSIKLSIDGDFYFGTSLGDFTVKEAVPNYYIKTEAVFTFTYERYIKGATVSKSDGTLVSDDNITITGAETKTLTISIKRGTTFGKITLELYTHTPLDKDGVTTISGIADSYIDDGFNEPVPTVNYQEGSHNITLTRDVDYTVSYRYSSVSGKRVISVTGIGEYSGTKTTSFTVIQPKISDFRSLGGNTYAIDNTTDLNRLAVFVNNGNNCDGYTFKQTADIQYTYETGWDSYITVAWDDINQMYTYDPTKENNYNSIGGMGKSFLGTYDGQHYAISGIRIYKEGNGDQHKSKGLFGFVGTSGIVKNIVLSDASITGHDNTGGIVGYNSGLIEDCIVQNNVGVWTMYPGANHHGGIAGINAGSIIRCTSSAHIEGKPMSGTNNNGEGFGAIAGYQNTNGSISNCIAIDALVSCSNLNEVKGAIIGINNGTLTNNYFKNCTVSNKTLNIGTGSGDVDGAHNVFSLTLGTGITAEGESVVISGSTYYASKTTVALSYSNLPAGKQVIYSLNGTPLEGSSFTMPDADATVTATVSVMTSLTLSATEATLLGETKYVTTFYQSTYDYQLPAGALAYTASLDGGKVVFHRIGERCDIIPANTAAVIVADASALTEGKITLTKLDSASGITPHSGNILQGSDVAIPTPSGTVYVLGEDADGVLGFYRFSGTTIPAGKAYYVVQ